MSVNTTMPLSPAASAPIHNMGDPPKSSRIGFLDLSAELRNEIYQLANPFEQLVDVEKIQAPPAAGLFATCRRIQREAVPVFYGSNTFTTYRMKGIIKLLEKLPSSSIRLIQRIEVQTAGFRPEDLVPFCKDFKALKSLRLPAFYYIGYPPKTLSSFITPVLKKVKEAQEGELRNGRDFVQFHTLHVSMDALAMELRLIRTCKDALLRELEATGVLGPSRAGFLDLPPELRNRIYHLVIPHDQTIDPCNIKHSTNTALLATSKQINQEASSILYGSNKIATSSLKYLLIFLGLLPPSSVQLIRHTVVLYGSGCFEIEELNPFCKDFRALQTLKIPCTGYMPYAKTMAERLTVLLQKVKEAQSGTLQNGKGLVQFQTPAHFTNPGNPQAYRDAVLKRLEAMGMFD